MFLPTTKELWEAIMENYSDLGNSTQIFELKSKIDEIKQEDQGVTKYYNILKSLWQEFDFFFYGFYGFEC